MSVIMVDEDTNRPVTGDDGVKLLEERAAEDALADVGLSVSSFVAPVAPPPPTDPPKELCEFMLLSFLAKSPLTFESERTAPHNT